METCDLDGPEWFGWTTAIYGGIGIISTMLYGSTNCIRLDFGNCCREDQEGLVRVYLDGKFIDDAGPNTPSKVIEFPIPHNSLLELKDEGKNSKIKFNGLEMLECKSKLKVSN